MVGALLAPHPKGPQPSALGDFNVPTAEEGRAIPVIFGTCMVKGGNTVWWGDLKAVKLKQGGGFLAFGRTQVVGYKYYIGLQFMLAHGTCDLVDIQADVKHVNYSAGLVLNGDLVTENYLKVVVDDANLFGGTKAGGAGGLAGTIDFYRGVQTQQPDDYLSEKQGRVALGGSGTGYTFAGFGNGTITGLSGGASSREETFTVTAYGIDTTVGHPHFNKMKFIVVGSVSGHIHNTVDSDDAWADFAFSSTVLNMTITTGSTQYHVGDVFTIKTSNSHVAPAYRGLCYAVWRQLYVGTSNYLKPIAFVLRRIPDPLGQGAGVANISGDANPALMIYELLTSLDYGLGIPGSAINASSFMAAAVTLHGEGLGISMQIDTPGSADQLIGEMLRHCDGLLYTDPATGLWTIVLARADYDPTMIPVLDVDSVIGTPDFSRGSWSETSNLVNIRFLSRVNNFNTRTVRAYDPANVKVTGEVRPQTIDFNGISKETAAQLVATRVLKTLTYPLAKMKLVANRKAWNFRPGGVFRFTWAPLGISNQVFRITRIGYGELTDGKISMDVVEDIFGISSVAFDVPPASGWIYPVGAPAVPIAQELIELPYHILQDGIHALALLVRGDGTTRGFEIWLDEGSGYFFSNEVFATVPSGLLAAAYSDETLALDPTGFTLSPTGLVDIDTVDSVTPADLPAGTLLCLIDQEILSVQIKTVNVDGSVTFSNVLRGVCDTVPVSHAAGARVWFISEGAGVTKNAPYPADLTISAKLLPQNSLSTFPIASASVQSLVTRSRFSRPYPPGKLCMQALAYGTRLDEITGGDLVLTWKSRNRLTQTAAGTVVAQDFGDITPEASTTYDVVVKDANGATFHTETALVLETWTYTMAQRAADGPTNPDPMTVYVYSNRGGSLESFMPNELTLSMTGFGMDFGRFFGGVNA